jgi:hypothetical protein
MGRYSAGGGGVFQLSGTKVMPDFGKTGAAFPGAGGTTVMPWHLGQEICLPEYCSSHCKCCPQWEQLNFNSLITGFFSDGMTIAEYCRIVQHLFPSMGDVSRSQRVAPTLAPTLRATVMGETTLARVGCEPRSRIHQERDSTCSRRFLRCGFSNEGHLTDVQAPEHVSREDPPLFLQAASGPSDRRNRDGIGRHKRGHGNMRPRKAIEVQQNYL